MNAIIKPQTVVDPSIVRVRQAWREHAHTRTATASQHAALGLLLGKDLATMFTPISNATKLANGAYPNAGRDTAIAVAASGDLKTWAPWAHLLEAAQVKEKWGRKHYDMGSHPLLASALERVPR